MGLRLLLGLLKGIVVGAAVGVGFHFLNPSHSLTFLPWILFGVVGMVVGIVCGAPFWRLDNWVTTLLKGLVGFGIGVGLYAIGRIDAVNVDLGFSLLGNADTHLTNQWGLFAGVVGVLWGFLLELDESIGAKDKGSKGKAKG